METQGTLCYTPLMVNEQQSEPFVWLDASNPEREEVRALAERFDLDLTIAEDILQPASGAYSATGEHYVFIALHLPIPNHDTNIVGEAELDILIGKDWLITAHNDPIPALEEVLQVMHTEQTHNHHAPLKPVEGAALMLATLYRSLHDELTFMRGRIDHIEQRIFEGRERDMVEELSKVSRTLLSFKRTLLPHQNTLHEATQNLEGVFGGHSQNALMRSIDRQRALWAELVALEDIVRELRETNTALLYTKQNEIMKNLTIMAFVTFPLSLIAGIFGMNTVHTPLLGIPGDFWIIFGAMVLLTLLFFTFFKVKRWL